MSQVVLSRAILPASRRKQLAAACLQRWPNETCGVLLGYFQGDTVHVNAFQVIRNISPHPENAFMFDPEEWVNVFYDTRNRGQQIVGFFHSHPDGHLEPSAEDTKSQLLWGTYWIAGLSQNECKLAAYQPLKGGFWKPLAVEERKNDQL